MFRYARPTASLTHPVHHPALFPAAETVGRVLLLCAFTAFTPETAKKFLSFQFRSFS